MNRIIIYSLDTYKNSMVKMFRLGSADVNSPKWPRRSLAAQQWRGAVSGMWWTSLPLSGVSAASPTP